MRLMRMLTRNGHLIEEQGMSYLADIGIDTASSRCKRPRARIESPWVRARDRRC